MKSYELVFLKRARKQWKKLGSPVRLQFEKKLSERLVEPKIAGDQLRSYPGCYKIKLKAAGYRLIYRVDDEQILVAVLTVDRRDVIYDKLDDWLAELL